MKRIILTCILASASAAPAGTVYFDPPQSIGRHSEGEIFDISISQSDLGTFDSVALVFTFIPELEAEFTYDAQFLLSTTLPPPDPIHFCSAQYCHLLIGGNRFVSPIWDAPLLIGELKILTWQVPVGAYEILVSASAEDDLLGTPLSLLANGYDQEPLEGFGSIAIVNSIPEPTVLVLLMTGLGMAASSRPRILPRETHCDSMDVY